MMDIDFLFQLLNESGVSGNELSVLNLCRERVADKSEISYDRIGDLFANRVSGNLHRQRRLCLYQTLWWD